jgi:hypothetical protein
MTDLQDTNGWICLQMLRVAVNTLDKQSLIAEKEWSSSLEVGQEVNNSTQGNQGGM